MEKRRLERIEDYVLGVFRERATTRLLARDIFGSTATFANADLVRAFEDLEKRRRLLVRHTTEGNDWVTLTPEGAEIAGVPPDSDAAPPDSPPHPPRSST